MSSYPRILDNSKYKGQAEMNGKMVLAVKIKNDVIGELLSRKGFDDWYYGRVDEDIRDEIDETITSIVYGLLEDSDLVLKDGE